MLEWILTRFWVKQFEIKFQFNGNATIPLILCSKYMNKRLKSWNAIISSRAQNHRWVHIYERKGRNTWARTLTHGRSDWNTCTISTDCKGKIITTHFKQYKVEVLQSVTVKIMKKILPTMWNTVLLLQHYHSHNWVIQYKYSSYQW